MGTEGPKPGLLSYQAWLLHPATHQLQGPGQVNKAVQASASAARGQGCSHLPHLSWGTFHKLKKCYHYGSECLTCALFKPSQQSYDATSAISLFLRKRKQAQWCQEAHAAHQWLRQDVCPGCGAHSLQSPGQALKCHTQMRAISTVTAQVLCQGSRAGLVNRGPWSHYKGDGGASQDTQSFPSH